MAGRGSRLRPHTLITPKPLIPIAGKPIVQRLVEDIVALYEGTVEEIAFIIGDFGAEVEAELKGIAEKLGSKGTIYHQDEPLGTAHAIWQARDCMDEEIIIAFADTLFHADFKLNRERDGVIWVKKVKDPRAYGVVTLNEEGVIDELVEKPQEFVSDLAIIGIYYIKDGAALRNEIQYLLDNDIREKGEYQLTNALENLKEKGAAFLPGEVDEWMDCGNKPAVIDTTERVLAYEHHQGKNNIAESAEIKNSVILQPCYIGPNARIENSVIGPYVSIGQNTVVSDSIIKHSAIREDSAVANALLDHAMIGMKSQYSQTPSNPSVGDYTHI